MSEKQQDGLKVRASARKEYYTSESQILQRKNKTLAIS